MFIQDKSSRLRVTDYLGETVERLHDFIVSASLKRLGTIVIHIIQHLILSKTFYKINRTYYKLRRTTFDF